MGQVTLPEHQLKISNKRLFPHQSHCSLQRLKTILHPSVLPFLLNNNTKNESRKVIWPAKHCRFSSSALLAGALGLPHFGNRRAAELQSLTNSHHSLSPGALMWPWRHREWTRRKSKYQVTEGTTPEEDPSNGYGRNGCVRSSGVITNMQMIHSCLSVYYQISRGWLDSSGRGNRIDGGERVESWQDGGTVGGV